MPGGPRNGERKSCVAGAERARKVGRNVVRGSQMTWGLWVLGKVLAFPLNELQCFGGFEAEEQQELTCPNRITLATVSETHKLGNYGSSR